MPNPPHESAPDGDTEEDAEEMRRVGEPPELAEQGAHRGRPLRHGARGTPSGSRFGYVIGDTALLALALYRLALDRLAPRASCR